MRLLIVMMVVFLICSCSYVHLTKVEEPNESNTVTLDNGQQVWQQIQIPIGK